MLWVAIFGFVSGVVFGAALQGIYARHVIKKRHDFWDDEESLDARLSEALGPNSVTPAPDPLRERIQLRLEDEWGRRG